MRAGLQIIVKKMDRRGLFRFSEQGVLDFTAGVITVVNFKRLADRPICY